MKKPVYQVCVHTDIVDFERVVNEVIEKWYEPVGGIYHHNGEYLQAMQLVPPPIVRLLTNEEAKKLREGNTFRCGNCQGKLLDTDIPYICRCPNCHKDIDISENEDDPSHYEQ